LDAQLRPAQVVRPYERRREFTTTHQLWRFVLLFDLLLIACIETRSVHIHGSLLSCRSDGCSTDNGPFRNVFKARCHVHKARVVERPLAVLVEASDVGARLYERIKRRIVSGVLQGLHSGVVLLHQFTRPDRGELRELFILHKRVNLVSHCCGFVARFFRKRVGLLREDGSVARFIRA